MDGKIVDICLEYLEVVFHNALYVSNIYPKSIYERRSKYDLPIRYCIHPDVNDYIAKCLLSIKQLLVTTSLDRIDIDFFAPDRKKASITFDINYSFSTEMNQDPYMIQLEQSLRSHFLKMMNLPSELLSLPENSSFKIFMHTNEASAVNIGKNPDLEDFQLSEVSTDKEHCNIIPLSSTKLKNVVIQTYFKQV